jgi:hypothetical protein
MDHSGLYKDSLEQLPSPYVFDGFVATKKAELLPELQSFWAELAVELEQQPYEQVLLLMVASKLPGVH